VVLPAAPGRYLFALPYLSRRRGGPRSVPEA